jgi:hypothetical protein
MTDAGRAAGPAVVIVDVTEEGNHHDPAALGRTGARLVALASSLSAGSPELEALPWAPRLRRPLTLGARRPKPSRDWPAAPSRTALRTCAGPRGGGPSRVPACR